MNWISDKYKKRFTKEILIRNLVIVSTIWFLNDLYLHLSSWFIEPKGWVTVRGYEYVKPLFVRWG